MARLVGNVGKLLFSLEQWCFYIFFRDFEVYKIFVTVFVCQSSYVSFLCSCFFNMKKGASWFLLISLRGFLYIYLKLIEFLTIINHILQILVFLFLYIVWIIFVLLMSADPLDTILFKFDYTHLIIEGHTYFYFLFLFVPLNT